MKNHHRLAISGCPPYFALGAALLLPLLSPSLTCLPLLPATSQLMAQEGEGRPHQPGLMEGKSSFVHKDEPRFAFQIPKKKAFKAIRARWRFIDVDARKKAALERVDKQLEAERAKEPNDEERIQDLEWQRNKIEERYARHRMLLEVDGDPTEWIRIDVEELQNRQVKLEDLTPKKEIDRWREMKILRDEESTTKAMRKKRRLSHRLEVLGIIPGSSDRSWVRFETYLVYSKDQQKRFRLLFIHRVPAEKYGKKKLREAEMLFHCLRM
ncbi:MAG: hypothetical protein ACE5GW_07725 [Planctomycetota bacterium]